MMEHKNTLLAIILSGIVLIAWQYFFGLPQMEKQRQTQQPSQQQQTPQPAPQTPPGMDARPQPQTTPQAPGQQQPAQPPGAAPQAPQMTRADILARSRRVPIETGTLRGSINLSGGRIDDLALTRYRETVDPRSPPIALLSPSGTANPFYAEFGWVGAAGANVSMPGSQTEWRQEGSGPLSVGKPVTLVWDNEQGLQFRREISVDDKYLFTVKDSVTNASGAPVTLYPYGLISRHNTPKTEGFYILHEGMIGVLGEQGLQEYTYGNIEEKKVVNFKVSDAWLGITDKYWGATLMPDPKAPMQARFSFNQAGGLKTYQTDYLLDARAVAPGETANVTSRLFAGAKEVDTIDYYERTLNLNRFDRLIDWGWFYFITKPLFQLIDWLYRLFGNFGVAILAVTVLIKAVFFPLANKSYASMAKMKAVQPQMMAIRDRYADDKMKQQQELMELYKREKINPLAGCLPIVVQIPVFFALYKVLFVTIEMRHAPFFGWIKDLSAPDPTTIFNLFGLIPWDPSQVPVFGPFLMLGVWPIIMGVTMWMQMKLNPAPPDPTQKMIFDWMPLIFTFMLASFSAGLVIYWAWNNTLSVIQQSIIMRRHGAKIELWDNVKAMFPSRKTE